MSPYIGQVDEEQTEQPLRSGICMFCGAVRLFSLYAVITWLGVRVVLHLGLPFAGSMPSCSLALKRMAGSEVSYVVSHVSELGCTITSWATSLHELQMSQLGALLQGCVTPIDREPLSLLFHFNSESIQAHISWELGFSGFYFFIS